MKKLTIKVVLGIVCLIGKVYGQGATPIVPLKTGEALPSLTLTQLVNSKEKIIKTVDYQDQLLIIDFWSTWCTSCIKMFTTIDNLQQTYRGKVRFIAVDSYAGDTKDKLHNLFARHPEWKFATVYGDTVLSRLFPHRGVPHYVWIKNNRFIGTSNIEAIDADTLAAVLAKDYAPYNPEKKDYQYQKPIFFAGNGGEPAAYIYRSLLTPYLPNLKSTRLIGSDDHGMVGRYLLVNSSKYDMFATAYPQIGTVNPNLIIINQNVTELDRQYGHTFPWYQKNLFVYEAIFPPRPASAARLILQADIKRFFGLELDSAVVEKACFVFSTKGTCPTHATMPNIKKESNWYTPETNIPITLTNYPLDETLTLLDEVSELPVVNETKTNPKIDIRLEKPAFNEQELRSVLHKYGVQLDRAKRLVKVYIIRRNDPADHLSTLKPHE